MHERDDVRRLIMLAKREQEIQLAKEIERGRKIVFRGLLRTSFLIDRILDEWAKIADGKMKVKDFMNLYKKVLNLQKCIEI